MILGKGRKFDRSDVLLKLFTGLFSGSLGFEIGIVVDLAEFLSLSRRLLFRCTAPSALSFVLFANSVSSFASTATQSGRNWDSELVEINLCPGYG